MIPRVAKARLLDLLQRFPAVALLGPRQAGKTTLALSLEEQLKPQALYLDLELPSDRAKLADPELYLSQHRDRLVILDEIHRLPDIFQTLRSLIDRRRRTDRKVSQFLLLGLVSMDLIRHHGAETLAGRIAYLEPTLFYCSSKLLRAHPFGSRCSVAERRLPQRVFLPSQRPRRCF